VVSEEIFKNRPIRNKNGLWQFQRRLKCEKLTDEGRQVMAKAQLAFGKMS
jgi:hypothetical protein